MSPLFREGPARARRGRPARTRAGRRCCCTPPTAAGRSRERADRLAVGLGTAAPRVARGAPAAVGGVPRGPRHPRRPRRALPAPGPLRGDLVDLTALGQSGLLQVVPWEGEGRLGVETEIVTSSSGLVPRIVDRPDEAGPGARDRVARPADRPRRRRGRGPPRRSPSGSRGSWRGTGSPTGRRPPARRSRSRWRTPRTGCARRAAPCPRVSERLHAIATARRRGRATVTSSHTRHLSRRTHGRSQAHRPDRPRQPQARPARLGPRSTAARSPATSCSGPGRPAPWWRPRSACRSTAS